MLYGSLQFGRFVVVSVTIASMVCVLFICMNGLCLQDHDAHGPEFLKHMNRINSSTGAHLSVSFYDTFRVNVFKYLAIFCRLITHDKIGI